MKVEWGYKREINKLYEMVYSFVGFGNKMCTLQNAIFHILNFLFYVMQVTPVGIDVM